MAAYVTHLDRILAFVGATGNTAMSNVLPYVFFVALSMRWTRLAKLSVALAVLGVGIGVAAIVALVVDGVEPGLLWYGLSLN